MTRNCVDFKLVPNHMLAHSFQRRPLDEGLTEYSNYPSVGIFIPCYNEDVELVRDTVIGALNVDYPVQLLSVYLFDDGKDPSKRSVISERKTHDNVFLLHPT